MFELSHDIPTITKRPMTATVAVNCFIAADIFGVIQEC